MNIFIFSILIFFSTEAMIDVGLAGLSQMKVRVREGFESGLDLREGLLDLIGPGGSRKPSLLRLAPFKTTDVDDGSWGQNLLVTALRCW